MDLFRKRSTDYSDFAYREAVTKLKYLLAESYTPINIHKSLGGPLYKVPSTSFIKSDGSFYPGKRTVSPYPMKKPEFESSNEFGSFIKKQEDYIQQLEKESHSYRDELSKMLSKVRDVVCENERLRGGIEVNRSTNETEEESELDDKERGKRYCKLHHYTGPNIVYESRISELEAQLTQCRIELRKAQENAMKTPKNFEPTLGHDTNKQIEALQRERDELNETISNLQSLVNQLRDKEASATLKVKRSLDLVDQAHFDKNQLEMEVRRLKNDLERMNEKQRESLQESARRVNEAERRYAVQIERLNSDLATQWDTANRLSLDLDRSRRTEQDLRRDLATKNSIIEELKKELSTKTSNLQSEALSVGAEKDSLESDLAAARLAVERTERAGRQETARLTAEVSSLRQRLDRADADLLHARKENLRLAETISSLEKELDLSKMSKNTTKPEYKMNEDLATMIKDMDTKHAQSVAELETMVQSQNQLMEKLKNECRMLTERLEDSTTRHKEEMAGLQSNVEYLNSKLEAPVNYENREWRGDGEGNNYEKKLEGNYEDKPKDEQPSKETGQSDYAKETYQENAPGYDPNYNQTEYDQGYQEDQNYATDQGYSQDYAQDQGYTQEGQDYNTGQGYAQDQNYTGDQGYSATDQGYTQEYGGDQGYTGQEYAPNQEYQDQDYSQGQYAQDYPQYQEEKAESVPDPPVSESNVVSGVDASGSRIVAQQEEFIPQAQ